MQGRVQLRNYLKPFNEETRPSDLDGFLFMEEFRSVKGYNGVYQVSNLGRVKSYHGIKELILKSAPQTNGYLSVCLSKKGITKVRTVHQLVAESFLNHTPCKLKLVINHINFDKTDNRVENLQIVTQRENANQKHMESTSKYTGVCWVEKRKKWVSSITINRKFIVLGFFHCELEASQAYQEALKELLNK